MTAVQRARLLCLFAAMAVMALFLVASVHLRDLLGNLAVTRVSNTVGRIVTRAVEDTVQSGEFAYDKLISFQKDSQGGSPPSPAIWRSSTVSRPPLPRTS